jgi:Lrp/AsnC family leucine-responsive transcriptional regulator
LDFKEKRPMSETPMLDDRAWQLLQALQHDGRAPLKQLAEAAGLSIPATAERLKRLKDLGAFSQIAAQVDAATAGYGVRAMVGITVVGQAAKKALLDTLRRAAEVLECHHVAGEDSYVMSVVATDLQALERFLGSINGYGETRTSIVFSTPIPRRGLVRPGSVRAKQDLGQSGTP